MVFVLKHAHNTVYFTKVIVEKKTVYVSVLLTKICLVLIQPLYNKAVNVAHVMCFTAEQIIAICRCDCQALYNPQLTANLPCWFIKHVSFSFPNKYMYGAVMEIR